MRYTIYHVQNGRAVQKGRTHLARPAAYLAILWANAGPRSIALAALPPRAWVGGRYL